jgi:hypothetical protein
VSDAAGNPASCNFNVTVTDETDPVIDCPDDITVNGGATCSAVVTYTPTATDNCPGAVSVVCMPPSGSSFPLGTTEVCCTATDVSGNTAECCFNVTVNPFQFVLQDNTNGNCVVITRSCTTPGTPAMPDPATYCWKTGGGTIYTGSCFVIVNGAAMTIQKDPMDPNTIQGLANLANGQGNARLIAPTVSTNIFTILDSNIYDSVCVCVPDEQ